MIYEVNLSVDALIVDEFRDWLGPHIDEMLAFEGFEAATWFQVIDPPPQDGRVVWSVQYEVAREEDLERYLREDAATMRADGLERFGGRFSATRRILRPV